MLQGFWGWKVEERLRSVQSRPVQNLHVVGIDFEVSRQEFFDLLDFKWPVSDAIEFHHPAELATAMVGRFGQQEMCIVLSAHVTILAAPSGQFCEKTHSLSP